ncbi:hypothetical protein BLJ79_18095 [Arthrobacter sp. UCD-GKA]|uniref:hypothetical protein n=1 Tax=Arthrobacter sp. UCD-GKA TaxID=1913576 RepID=UPI0008DCE5F6|nr:hypothetical protein [Arthrobacter sp. UCD-GKA]OIH82857.1 hypothetical protein BLJ79_18095 [Arthrobacter sp. UCD-GKA]
MSVEAAGGRYHPFGRTLAEDLALLAAGEETGWWDESGAPAPWPQDFLDPAGGWADARFAGDPPWRVPPAANDGPAPF